LPVLTLCELVPAAPPLGDIDGCPLPTVVICGAIKI
jgi:hypothetical protein